jgi:hypothetical protein
MFLFHFIFLFLSDLSGMENWQDIAAYVGSKSPDECVKHFLQLPSERPADRMFIINERIRGNWDCLSLTHSCLGFIVVCDESDHVCASLHFAISFAASMR